MWEFIRWVWQYAVERRPGILQRLRSLHGDQEAVEVSEAGGWSRGRLWVMRREGSRLLAVVYEGRMPVAEIEMPELSEIFEIGGDYILGMHRGALDVESVRLYSYVAN